MPATDEPQLLVVGCVADVIEDQLSRCFAALGVAPVRFLPARQSTDLPGIGPRTVVLPAQPYVGETVRQLLGRGAKVLSAPYPLGAEGTVAWFTAAAREWGISPAVIARTLAPYRERARQGLATHRERLRGKRAFLMPDSQLEIPLARFMQQELEMDIVEVGTPYLDQQMVGADVALLLATTQISEGQDVDAQLARVRRTRPDLVICGLGLANPLEAEGLATKWSIETIFTPIQGFDHASDLAEILARPLTRRARLAV